MFVFVQQSIMEKLAERSAPIKLCRPIWHLRFYTVVLNLALAIAYFALDTTIKGDPAYCRHLGIAGALAFGWIRIIGYFEDYLLETFAPLNLRARQCRDTIDLLFMLFLWLFVAFATLEKPKPASGQQDVMNQSGESQSFASNSVSAMTPSVSRIDEKTFKGVTSALYGLAMLLTIARISQRLHRFRRLFVDDIFLLIAAAFLTAGTIIVHIADSHMYQILRITAGLEKAPADISDLILNNAKASIAMSACFMATLFAVKFSFLFFFRSLTRSAKKISTWWWVVFAILILAYCLSVGLIFVGCHVSDKHFCFSKNESHSKIVDVRGTVILDVVTELLLISIPVTLLWNSRIELPRKIALLGLFCLSIVTITIAIVLVTTTQKMNGYTDIIWLTFLFTVQSNIALIMLCLGAFRTLFLSKATPKAEELAVYGEPVSQTGLVEPQDHESSLAEKCAATSDGENARHESQEALVHHA